ncbi:MAG: peptidylprolyl isomerase [Pseudomonadota bacterium]
MADAIKTGDTISVDYTGKLENGDVFDTSSGKTPLKFTVGSGMLIKGFDRAVIGMKPGEKTTVVIAPEDGYGPRNEDHYIDIPRTQFPDEIPLETGLALELEDPNGRPVPAVISKITDESVRMDINHFLAGKTLEFDIQIVETGLTADPVFQNCGSGCNCKTSCGDGSACDSDGCH